MVEIQKQAKEQNVNLVIMDTFTVYGRKDILDAQSKQTTQQLTEGGAEGEEEAPAEEAPEEEDAGETE